MLKFPADFFMEETKCGFVVSSMMKRAWAAQMEVLQVIAEICEQNEIQYFADSGTLLGAVRHQGFIPWDDDIDIALKREDYNRLIEICQKELPEGLVLRGMYAEHEAGWDIFPGFHSRVTTDACQWSLTEHMKRFHGFPYPGAGIDIFVYDYLPREKEDEELQDMICDYGKMLLNNWGYLQKSGELENRLLKLEELSGIRIQKSGDVQWFIQKLLDSVASLYGKEESDEMTIFISVSRERRKEEFRVRKECLEKVTYLPFEQIEIPVPQGYQELLTAMYGDYMTFEKSPYHGYPWYASQEKGLLKQIRGLGYEDTVEEFCKRAQAEGIKISLV